MKRIELLGVVLASYAMIIVGLVLLFGPWALVGGGVAAIVGTLFFDVEEV